MSSDPVQVGRLLAVMQPVAALHEEGCPTWHLEPIGACRCHVLPLLQRAADGLLAAGIVHLEESGRRAYAATIFCRYEHEHVPALEVRYDPLLGVVHRPADGPEHTVLGSVIDERLERPHDPAAPATGPHLHIERRPKQPWWRRFWSWLRGENY